MASLLVVLVAVRLLLIGLESRSAALGLAALEAVPRWNGLILGSILLLLVGSLAFFFTLGLILWSSSRPGIPARSSGPAREDF